MARKKKRQSKPKLERPRHLSQAQRARMVRMIWARIPTGDLHCRGLCHDSCGAIGYSVAERKVMAAEADAIPVSQGELRGGRFERKDDIMCSMLTPEKACGAYEQRPAICRLYGLLEELPCAHGCIPKAWMAKEEAQRVIAELNAIEGLDERSHYLAALVAALARREQGITR